MVKCLSTMWETWVQSLNWEDPLEKEMAMHSSTVAWKIPWTEEPGRLQSMGSQRVGHDWVTSLSLSHLYLDEHIYISEIFLIYTDWIKLYFSLPFLYNMLEEFFHLKEHVSVIISKDYCSVQMLAYPILHASALKTGTMCVLFTGCLHIFSIVNMAVICIEVHVSFQINVYFLLIYN